MFQVKKMDEESEKIKSDVKLLCQYEPKPLDRKDYIQAFVAWCMRMVVGKEMTFDEIEDTKATMSFKRLSEHAIAPMWASHGAAGYDLFSAETKEIASQERGIVKTDIAIMLPYGTYGRIAPRSGLAVERFIGVGGGVIDYDYRGNIGVVLFNHQKESFQVHKGDRIAQLIVEKICNPKLVEVDELEETDRGVNGYGSTGK